MVKKIGIDWIYVFLY